MAMFLSRFMQRTGSAVAVSGSSMRHYSKRTFPSFIKYGPHAAFQVQPVAPVYAPVSGRDYLKTKRLGSMMLSWANASEPGKNYSFNDKVFFSLSPTEIGLVLEVLDGNLGEVTITHTPNVNAQDTTEKVLRSLLDVKRITGADGHPLTEFNVSTSEVEERVALNAGEARVLKELLTYSLPRLYGFHSLLEGPLTVDGGNDSGNDWSGSSNSSNSGRAKNQFANNTNRGGGGAAPEWPF